jgi:SAM-dependent methyltransferase
VTADDLYLKWHPDYFETQRKDLWYYERLWSVLLRELEKRTKGRWLVEFGSGPGFLLALAERRGWRNARGIEPSPIARAHAASLGVVSAEEWPYFSSVNDAALATEVLEHVEDPTTTLREWGEALVPGGYLALSVPNDNNPLQRLFWGKSKPWVHPTHLHYFNRDSLRRVVEEAGFEVVWERTSFPVELLLVIPFLPRKVAWKLSRLWPAPPFLWRFRIGRHLLFVCRKP